MMSERQEANFVDMIQLIYKGQLISKLVEEVSFFIASSSIVFDRMPMPSFAFE
jgi:hypothetical protein